MPDGSEALGKASLELEANLSPFELNLREAHRLAESLQRALAKIVAVATGTKDALRDVRMEPGQAAESRVTASAILEGVKHISRESIEAAHELDRVKMHERQAAESEVPATLIGRMLERITGKANEARRAIESVRLVGGIPGRSGVGVGPFGSGFGRVGLLGTAVASGALLAPAAGPGAAGLLAAIPGLALTGAAALGTLALAAGGVGKAIKGDKKAFEELSPAAQKFVLTIRSLSGWFDKLKETAAKGLFPGVTAGLHAALSPGTVGVLTRSVSELTQALGAAFAQWGRYFGSPRFQALLGPLMQAGAKSVRVLSDAMLHLFDAFLVLGRAAIPFSIWLNRAIDRGARLASTWMRAKEASGALGHGLDEAKTSLRLVSALFVSLLRVVGALGRALYPISKIAVKQLTNGLNALAGMINRNRATIREIVGGALAAFVASVKVASRVVGVLFRILNKVAHAIGGWKTAFEIVISGFLAAKFVSLAKALRRLGASEAGAATKAGSLRTALLRLRAIGPISIVIAFAYETFFNRSKFDREVTGFLRGHGLGYFTGAHFESMRQLNEAIASARKMHANDLLKMLLELKAKVQASQRAAQEAAHPRPDDRAGPRGPGAPPRHRHRHRHTTHPESPFGKPPPFKDTKRRGAKPPVIPAPVSHLEALAAQEASMAAAAKSAKEQRKHLEREINDLQKADRLLHKRYAHAHGRNRTRLFAEITRVENAIRRARAEIQKKLDAARKHGQQGREAELKLAVDRAKLAVENAKEGTAAYNRAVKAEERALAAEIRYYDKRAHNAKLSAKARDKALREEIAAKHQLNELHKKAKHADATAGANEAQFLSSFKQIVSSFAPNAFPIPGAAVGGSVGKSNTHLHQLVEESRKTNHYLRDLVAKHAFPATGYAIESAGAVAG